MRDYELRKKRATQARERYVTCNGFEVVKETERFLETYEGNRDDLEVELRLGKKSVYNNVFGPSLPRDQAEYIFNVLLNEKLNKKRGLSKEQILSKSHKNSKTVDMIWQNRSRSDPKRNERGSLRCTYYCGDDIVHYSWKRRLINIDFPLSLTAEIPTTTTTTTHQARGANEGGVLRFGGGDGVNHRGREEEEHWWARLSISEEKVVNKNEAHLVSSIQNNQPDAVRPKLRSTITLNDVYKLEATKVIIDKNNSHFEIEIELLPNTNILESLRCLLIDLCIATC